MTTKIAIVADYDPRSKSHQATNDAIHHSAKASGLRIAAEWMDTTEVDFKKLITYPAIWIGPGSPYKSMAGALSAIQCARENLIPLLGTCGGFQHIILEYARNVMGFTNAAHEETDPGMKELFISRLSCSLVGRTMPISVKPNSQLARLYGVTTVMEEYLCNFGVNPVFVDSLKQGNLIISASDPEGLVRAVELPSHPFFIGTLFLPQHRSTAHAPHPVISAFIQAATEKGS